MKPYELIHIKENDWQMTIDIAFLRFRDESLPPEIEIRKTISRILDEIQPYGGRMKQLYEVIQASGFEHFHTSLDGTWCFMRYLDEKSAPLLIPELTTD